MFRRAIYSSKLSTTAAIRCEAFPYLHKFQYPKSQFSALNHCTRWKHTRVFLSFLKGNQLWAYGLAHFLALTTCKPNDARKPQSYYTECGWSGHTHFLVLCKWERSPKYGLGKKEICSISVNVIFPLFCRALGLFACFNISPMVIMAITKVKVQISLSLL